MVAQGGTDLVHCWKRWTLSACLVVAAAAGAAAPADERPTVPPTPFDCAAGHWVLDGARVRAGQGDGATFNPDWQPTLEGIAGCVRSPAWRTACVAIRGHTDAIAFNDPVVVAFGSVEAAQLARGRGRSVSVLTRLTQLGVPPDRLRELPPAEAPDYRGVELSVVLGCASPHADTTAPLTQADLRSAVRESVRDELSEQRRQDALTQPAPALSQHRFWAEAGLTAALVGTTPDSAFGPVAQLGAGWRFRHVYARADLGLTLGSTAPQRVGWELGGAVGYFHAPWLQVGVIAGDRFSASSLSTGWLEQTWALGLEGTHCLWRWREYDLCAREAVLPLGGRTRRGEEVNGQLYRIPDTHDSALRFELGASVRREL